MHFLVVSFFSGRRVPNRADSSSHCCLATLSDHQLYLMFEYIESVAGQTLFLFGIFMHVLLQAHWGTPPTPVNVGTPEAVLKCTCPNCYFFLINLSREGFPLRVAVFKLRSGSPDSCSRSSSPNSDWLYKRQQGTTPTLTVSVSGQFPFSVSRQQGGESFCSGPSCCEAPKAKGKCQLAERVTSPSGLGVARLASL